MNHTRAIIYGIAIWAFPFIVAMLAFPLRTNDRPLFESIMPVALVLAVTVASVKYFQKVNSKFFVYGYCLGLLWLTISLILDATMFSWGPMKMTLSNYLKDIGTAYLLIPIIPTGIGYLLENKRKK